MPYVSGHENYLILHPRKDHLPQTTQTTLTPLAKIRGQYQWLGSNAGASNTKLVGQPHSEDSPAIQKSQMQVIIACDGICGGDGQYIVPRLLLPALALRIGRPRS